MPTAVPVDGGSRACKLAGGDHRVVAIPGGCANGSEISVCIVGRPPPFAAGGAGDADAIGGAGDTALTTPGAGVSNAVTAPMRAAVSGSSWSCLLVAIPPFD